MASAEDQTTAPIPTWPVWAGLALLTALRIALIPSYGNDVTPVFGHDSAYIALVANNLLGGRGYVNDAHWLLFVEADTLPVRFHNANPLYPTLVAGLSWLTGREPIWCGLALSRLSGSLLFAALFLLAGRWQQEPWPRVAIASGGLFFPAVFDTTLQMLPDALCTALQACCLALVVLGHGWRAWAGAGLCLGLAWLTRSSALLLVPSLAVFAVAQLGWKQALAPLGVLGGVALVVVSPWLVHTQQAWGDPFRSDAGYYLWQDYHAHRQGITVEQYWHGVDRPPGLKQMLQESPGDFVRFQAAGGPILLKSIVAGWTRGSRLVAALLGLFLVLAALQLRGQIRATPLTLAAVVFVAVTLLAYVPRARSMEDRYAAPVAVIVGMFLATAACRAYHGTGHSAVLNALTLSASTGFWLMWVPLANISQVATLNAVDRERVELRGRYQYVSERLGTRQPVIVGTYPYYFTYYTDTPSVAIPAGSDAELEKMMRRYDAHAVVLTPGEVDAWRPRWRTPAKVPPFLRPLPSAVPLAVFVRKD